MNHLYCYSILLQRTIGCETTNRVLCGNLCVPNENFVRGFATRQALDDPANRGFSLADIQVLRVRDELIAKCAAPVPA